MRLICPAFLVGILLPGGSFGAMPGAAAAAPGGPEPAPRTELIPFDAFNAGPIMLRGSEASASLSVGTRADEVVVGAVLHLRFTYSPALLPELSHLRVTVNGQAVAALPLAKADGGREIERDVVLDPRYFSDYTTIRLDLIAHYSLGCETPDHSSLWTTISTHSDLTLTLRPLDLRDDLAALPAPFFDARDNHELVLPFLFGANPSRETLRSAGVAASWFGMLADYRGARFVVSFDALPTSHAVVFATNDSRPARLALPAVELPTVSVIDDPENPRVKYLVLQGKDDAQLRSAVEGLALGSGVLSGASATIKQVRFAPRAAYDAPRWVRTDRPVKLGELIASPDQLQASGRSPPPITVNLRLPPDLFTWHHGGVPVDLHYRYTAPADKDQSHLTVTVNDQLVRAYRLTPQSDTEGDGKFHVPLLGSDAPRDAKDLLIPAFQLTSGNRMQFRFTLEDHREGVCASGGPDDARESIDPDSTIDISQFPHFAILPNLAMFANAGYPFTRYADLAQTGIVLPDAADHDALEQLFFVLGRMGRETGLPALSFRLLDDREALAAGDLDLLILSGARSNALVAGWGRDLPLVLGAAQRVFHPGAVAGSSTLEWTPPDTDASLQAAEVGAEASGSLGVFLAFESPLHAGRSVVALLGTDAAGARELAATLADESKLGKIRGDLAIVRGGDVQSFRGAQTYYVGNLGWWQWLWLHFAQHALLLGLAAVASAIAFGLLLYGWLQRVAARRLETR